jgi:hypothetical protein
VSNQGIADSEAVAGAHVGLIAIGAGLSIVGNRPHPQNLYKLPSNNTVR